jgi:hypothetical protein
MSFAVELSQFVYFLTAGGDHFRFERKIAAGYANAVELEFQISLAPEVAGIFGVLEVANQITSARECLLAEDGYAAKVAENGVSNVDRCRREIGLIERTLQKSAGGDNHIARAGAHSENAKGYC